MAIKPQDKSTPVELKAMIHPDVFAGVQAVAKDIDSEHDYTLNAILSDWLASYKSAATSTKKKVDATDPKPSKPRAKSAAAGGH